jgi:hypothetical protein
MLLSKRFHKIFWDTYVSRDVRITQLMRAKALIRLVPSESYISHHTAAELWGAAPPADGCHSHHSAVSLRTPGSPRSAIALSETFSANHASQGLAHLYA